MSISILVVEDVKEIYEYYLRVFEQILPVEDIEFTHASSIKEACEVLEQPFDIILMDYALGAPFLAPGATKSITDGAGLVKVRRFLEGKNIVKPAQIFGISSAKIGNDLLIKAGAHYAYLKVKVEELANSLKTVCQNLKGK